MLAFNPRMAGIPAALPLPVALALPVAGHLAGGPVPGASGGASVPAELQVEPPPQEQRSVRRHGHGHVHALLAAHGPPPAAAASAASAASAGQYRADSDLVPNPIVGSDSLRAPVQYGRRAMVIPH